MQCHMHVVYNTHKHTHTFSLFLKECQVESCSVCDSDPTKCDTCEKNGRFDETDSACIRGDDGGGQTCNDKSNSVALITVSAASLILIITLVVIVFIQCLLIFRIKKVKNQWDPSNQSSAQLSTQHMDVPTTPNMAYALTKVTNSRSETEYEVIV